MLLYISSKKFGKDTTFLKDWITKHNNEIALIPNALDSKGEEKLQKNLKEDIELLEEIGFKINIIDLKEYFGKYDKLKEKLSNYNTYCVMGGNVFVLNKAIKLSNFDMFLKEKKNDDNYLYIGYSAGSCVLSKNLKPLAMVDEPISFYGKTNIDYEGVGFIDYTIIPHYKSDYHKSELIDNLVLECQKQKIKFKTIKDGEVIIEKTK